MNDLWQPVDLADGETVRRTFGPIALELSRHAFEWRVMGEEVEEPVAYVGPKRMAREFEPVRLAAGVTAPELRVAPALADRGVVARPEAPIYILAGESVELFVSTPVWVQLHAGDAKRVLYELPTVQLADTWFGEVTGDGELCYASRTGARTTLEPVLLQPARALTVIELTNRGDAHLLLERLKLPVPYLSLYLAEDDSLWTERLEVTSESGSDRVEVSLGNGSPEQAGATTRVADPRTRAPRRSFVRALGALLR